MGKNSQVISVVTDIFNINNKTTGKIKKIDTKRKEHNDPW